MPRRRTAGATRRVPGPPSADRTTAHRFSTATRANTIAPRAASSQRRSRPASPVLDARRAKRASIARADSRVAAKAAFPECSTQGSRPPCRKATSWASTASTKTAGTAYAAARGVRRATAYARAKLLSRNMLLRSRIPPSSLWVACIAALPGPRVTTISAYAVASPTPRPDRDDRARRRRASPATASPAKTNPRLLSVLAGWRKKASRACSQNSIPRAASGPNHPYATASTNPVHPIRAQTATARNTLAG